ncbi:MAG: ABC transporter substrate-binding protein [Crenarchaeota archaeon]|jgi:iron complex transport system substrate-binding protein|nr:ABC transporter substrate-binding protein [Thermoproteota archaeon]
MKKNTIALIAVALVLIIVVASGIYTFSHFSPETTTQDENVLTIVDPNGDTVKITQPVNGIVCTDAIATEIVCALGCENRIVGVDTSSDFPPLVKTKKSVGEPYSVSIEQILKLAPDLVLAGAPINYFNNQTSSRIEDAGIPVFICHAINPSVDTTESTIDTTCSLVTQIGKILEVQDKATELVNYMQNYQKIVNERLANLTESDKPSVYYEWYQDWQTMIVPTIVQVGGINIAENQTEVAPMMSPEYVAEANPDFIIRMISSSNNDIADFKDAQNQLTTRPALKNSNAVKDGNVYICDYGITGGVQCVVGYLQWAKWFHPDIFSDIDPPVIHQQLLDEFFNITIGGVYAYP